MKISPHLLYPTISFTVLDKDKLDQTIVAIDCAVELPPVEVIEYESHYYIVMGHYIMLASCIAKVDFIDVEIIDYRTLNGWKTAKQIEENLQSISVSTLYDFEAVGGFLYSVYPKYYRR